MYEVKVSCMSMCLYRLNNNKNTPAEKELEAENVYCVHS